MSRLEELIAELCPDGVEYKTLGEIATDIYRGSGIKREQVMPTGTPCVRYGEIYTTYGSNQIYRRQGVLEIIRCQEASIRTEATETKLTWHCQKITFPP